MNPQEEDGTVNKYYAGLFRDNDAAWMVYIPGLPSENCQPIPFWVNLFTQDENSVALVPTETVFDTDDATPEITPDNIHLHHEHDLQRRGWITSWFLDDNPFVEAPGSLNGTFHLHWRWGRFFKGFGAGRLLLPPNQH